MGRSTGRLTISARKQAPVDVVKVVVYARRSISNKTPQNLQILPKLHQKSLVVYSSSEILQLFVKSSSRLFCTISYASGCSSRKGFQAPIINGGFSSSSCADLRQRLNGAPIFDMAASFCKFRGVAAFLCRFKVCADFLCLGNATVSHVRAFFRLQRQTRGLQQVRSERATYLRCFGNQRGKTSDVGSRVINSSEVREVGVNELRRRRANKTRERRKGCM